MTIGELFIKLGFKIDGDKDLQGVERSMTRATGSATKLALEVAALNAAFFYMIETSLKAAVALRTFSLSTGESTDELQLWQHAAVVNGLTANDLTTAIMHLQQVQKDFAMGKPSNLGAWGMLGVDPTQGTPFQILDALRKRILQFKDVGVARNLLGQIGLADMLPLLRSTNAEWEKWSQNFVITAEQTRKLTELNAAWQSLKLSVESVKTQFSVVFVPILGVLARALEWVAQAAAVVVRWLQSASPVAAFFRGVLQILAVVLIGLGIILTGLIAILGTLAAVIAFLASGVGALVIEFAPFVLLVGASLIAIAGLILLLQDLWTQLRGGRSAFDWLHSSVPYIWAFAHGLENILKVWKELKLIANGGLPHQLSQMAGGALAYLLPHMPHSGGNSRTDVHNDITVNEAVSAKATSRELMRSLEDLHRSTLNQAPVRNY